MGDGFDQLGLIGWCGAIPRRQETAVNAFLIRLFELLSEFSNVGDCAELPLKILIVAYSGHCRSKAIKLNETGQKDLTGTQHLYSKAIPANQPNYYFGESHDGTPDSSRADHHPGGMYQAPAAAWTISNKLKIHLFGGQARRPLCHQPAFQPGGSPKQTILLVLD